MASHSHRTSSADRAIYNILKRSPGSAATLFASLALGSAVAHGNVADEQRVLNRADVVNLPAPLKNVLARMARRPHTYSPMRAFAEADKPSRLFEYYLLDTRGFQPNIFTAIIPGINDGAIPTAANAANGQLRTIGTVRVVLEPKPGLPTDPEDVEAFIDIFTDIRGSS